jgi:hypothetical protein
MGFVCKCFLPKGFCYKGHKRMEELESFLEDIFEMFLRRFSVLFCTFQVIVGEIVPDKIIESFNCFVKPVFV